MSVHGALTTTLGWANSPGVEETLILASASPRRAAVLAAAGIPARIVPSGIEERPGPGEDPERFVARMAREKAAAVAARFPDCWVLGADTEVALDGQVLGKPEHAQHAAAMLRRLSGREHRVLTGFALLAPGGALREQQVVTTRVRMRACREDEIEQYVASGEPMDKAGGYAIQGGGARFVAEVVGSYSNVVGLPVDEVCDALRRWGLLE